jgi:MoaA/NifB/PqqE/SkfB family radical SAM enzyme
LRQFRVLEIFGNVIRRIFLAAKHRFYLIAKRWGINRRTIRSLISWIPLPGVKPDEAILANAEPIIQRAIALGRKGLFKVVPEFISISATENCNLKCIMCPGHAQMSGPKLSLDEAEILFSSLIDNNANFGRPKRLDMTAGEPTLNQALGPIYRRFKELFPSAKICMISNATIPIRGRIREAFELADYIGLSMDGATAETYERIRKGSVYKNVVRNVRDIAEMKKLGVNCDSLQLMFVAMDQNIHELPEMVRLAHSLGMPSLFAQASEIRSNTPFNSDGQNISLSLSKTELAPFVIEAKAEAKRLGIDLCLTSTLAEALEPSQPIHSGLGATQPSPTSFEVAIKTCSVPWTNAPRISQNKDGIHPITVCCHMPYESRSGNLEKRKEFRGKSIIEIFNSEFYWNIRSGLLDGTLAKDACEGCQYYQSTQWTAPQLRELEKATKAVERSMKLTSVT